MQFRNAIKSCKVFRVHGTLYVGIAHNSHFLPLQWMCNLYQVHLPTSRCTLRYWSHMKGSWLWIFHTVDIFLMVTRYMGLDFTFISLLFLFRGSIQAWMCPLLLVFLASPAEVLIFMVVLFLHWHLLCKLHATCTHDYVMRTYSYIY